MRRVLAWFGVAVLPLLFIAGCYGGPDAAHFVSVANELKAPASWQLVQSSVRDPNGGDRCVPTESSDCPGATRSFVAAGEPKDLYAQATNVAKALGFTIVQEFYPGCTGGPTGPICSFLANRGQDALFVTVFASPADAQLPPADAGTRAVVITAERSK
jgi:hypothetical protein